MNGARLEKLGRRGKKKSTSKRNIAWTDGKQRQLHLSHRPRLEVSRNTAATVSRAAAVWKRGYAPHRVGRGGEKKKKKGKGETREEDYLGTRYEKRNGVERTVFCARPQRAQKGW